MQEIIIPNYLRKVKLSESRKVKLYSAGNLPKAKKYQDKSKYDWAIVNGKSVLVELSTGNPVIANPKAMGTAKWQTINGQAIYNGQMHTHSRAKIFNELKESFAEYINKMDVITNTPIRIQAEIHDTVYEAGSLWDVDNRSWPYIKAFQDCLTGNRDKNGVARNKIIIEDDNILFITQPAVPLFIPVDTEAERMLVFRIIEETDERILKHPAYCKPCIVNDKNN